MRLRAGPQSQALAKASLAHSQSSSAQDVTVESEEDNFVVIPNSFASWLRGCSLVLHDLLLCAFLGLLILGMSATTAWWALEFFGPPALTLLQFSRGFCSLMAYLIRWRVWELLAAAAAALPLLFFARRICHWGSAAAMGLVQGRRQSSIILNQTMGLLESFSSSRDQQLKAGAISLSLQLTALPVLDIYSAVGLFAAPRGSPGLLGLGDGCSTWEVLHGPAFYLFGVRYIAGAVPTVLRAENDGGNCWWMMALEEIATFFDHAGLAAQVGLSCLAVIYSATIVLWATGFSIFEEDCSAISSRGLVLGLHALGMCCGTGLRLTLVQKKDDLLRIVLSLCKRCGPRLLRWLLMRSPEQQRDAIVAKFEQELQLVMGAGWSRRRIGRFADVVVSFNRWSPEFLEAVPTMREAAPAPEVVKSLVAVQHFSPLLALTAALVSQAEVWPRLAVAANLLLSSMILTYYMFDLGPDIPERKLERLVLLVPRFYVDPSTRAMLGYTLHATKQVRKWLRIPYRLLLAPYELLEVPKKALGYK